MSAPVHKILSAPVHETLSAPVHWALCSAFSQSDIMHPLRNPEKSKHLNLEDHMENASMELEGRQVCDQQELLMLTLIVGEEAVVPSASLCLLLCSPLFWIGYTFLNVLA